MRKSTITAALSFLFAVLLWSCNKEASHTSAEPNLPSTPYDYVHKMMEATRSTTTSTGNTLTGLKGTTFSWTGGQWGTKPGVVVVPSNPIISLGGVIFNDKITGLSNVSCVVCHSNAPQAPAAPAANTKQQSADGSQPHPAVGIEDADRLIAKMNNTNYYPKLFKQAYGTSDITADRISDALAQYMAVRKAIGSPNDPRFADPFK